MRKLLELRHSIILCLFLILLISTPCFGKTYAYLIGTDGKVFKLDVESDNILSTNKLKDVYLIQSSKQSVVADTTKNLLYVVHGRLTPRVAVFDLKTLEFKKDLGITSGSPDVMIIAPPLSNKFYVEWWDDEKNESVFTIYNATNFTKIVDLKPFSIITEDIMYSKDNTKLFSINDGYPAKIDAYNADNLELIKSIPLESVFTPDVFGRGIDDHQNEKVLIVENVKKTKDDPSNYTLYTYAIEDGIISKKILTGKGGESKLSPDGTKIFFNEKQYIYSQDGNHIESIKSVGRLYIYDVATGKKWGFVQFTVDMSSEIVGIHPNGNKAYMFGDIAGVSSLIVMDIVNLKIIKTIKIPESILFLIFYDE